MDTVKSFRGYGKVDPQEEQAFRRKTRKRMVILAVSLVLLVVLIVGVVAGTVVHKKKSGHGDAASSSENSPVQSLKAMCSVTANPDSCYSSISSMEGANSTTDPVKLFELSLKLIISAMETLSSLPESWINTTSDPQLKSALEVCHTVFEDAVDAANDSISLFTGEADQNPMSSTGISDLETWLSTSLTNLDTCVDALVEVNATTVDLDAVKTAMSNSTQFVSNSLAIVSKFLVFLDKFKNIPHRKLLQQATDSYSDGFPSWMRAADRKLLQAAAPKPDLVVAKDGSGDVTTIKAALTKVPKKSKTRFVVYVKAGTYNEQVTLEKQMWNVMMYGDGMNKTIISANVNFIDGTRTLLTATFSALGKGFIAKNMRFVNTAGPSKHQAVALRSTSDQSVFYQCAFDAYQDTLYAHTNRQFYSKCNIMGTVDFIFGNAAVIFQNCNIMPRQPDPNQFVTITAQGKTDPNQNTGITIQNCKVYPLDRVTVTVYYGRPWKNCSTTIFMQSNIDAIVDPQGWTEWTTDVVPPSTIFYAEYRNTGPGADVSRRVTWAGVRRSLTAAQAAKYTVGTFLNGQTWITAAQVNFT